MKILWCITGAGHMLEETHEVIESADAEVTLVYSRAGQEVARMYGLKNRLEDKAYEVITEDTQGASYPLVGRLPKKEYACLVVSPCTANTVAKIACGIADNLVTNLVAQAVKSKVPAYIVPTDMEKETDSVMPIYVDPKICLSCEKCLPTEKCPTGALYRNDGIRLDLLKCDACKKCIPLCPYSAISYGKSVKVHMRDIDLENARKLTHMEGITVVRDPEDIEI